MMKTFGVAVLLAVMMSPALFAQEVPEIPFDSVPNFFKLPADLHFGEFRPFLVFNVGDAAITIGVLLLLVRALLMRDGRAKKKEA